MSCEAAIKAVLSGRIKPGDVIVICYEEPHGGPGMREMLGVTSATVSEGYLKVLRSLLTTDSEGATHGFIAGRLWPCEKRLDHDQSQYKENQLRDPNSGITVFAPAIYPPVASIRT